MFFLFIDKNIYLLLLKIILKMSVLFRKQEKNSFVFWGNFFEMSRTDLHKLRIGSSKMISLVWSENRGSSSGLCKKRGGKKDCFQKAIQVALNVCLGYL